jgi:pimeloyl-ACP methyl ester carboxylesterase
MLISLEHSKTPIYYQRTGVGKPLLLLHNGGTSHEIWSDVIPSLASDFEVFAIDLPGFGKSPWPDGGCDLASYTNTIANFIKHFNLGPFCIASNCMGSAIAMCLAREYQDLVQCLILVNPLTAQTFSSGSLGPTLWIRQYLPTWVAKPLYRGIEMLPIPRAVHHLSLRLQIYSKASSNGVFKAWISKFIEFGQHSCYMRSMLSLHDDLPNYRKLDSLTTGVNGESLPYTCTIWGMQNRVLSAKAGQNLNKVLQPDRAIWLKNGGHLPMIEMPELIASTIKEVQLASESKYRKSKSVEFE